MLFALLCFDNRAHRLVSRFRGSTVVCRAGRHYTVVLMFWRAVRTCSTAQPTNSHKPCVDYPWASFPAGTRVCDVGGGKGHVAMALLKAHPHLKVVVQDLPGVIDDANKVRSRDHANSRRNCLIRCRYGRRKCRIVWQMAARHWFHSISSPHHQCRGASSTT